MTTTWLGVWTRAVIGPAYRRALASTELGIA
jgi:hypothetical protein